MSETQLELSRRVRVNEIGKAGLEFDLEADEEQRKAIAKRLGIVSLDRLEAKVEVKRWRRTGARMIVSVDGEMTRRCVVSLEDFQVPIHQDIEIRYADPSDDIAMPQEEGELFLDPDSDEPPEILEGGSFDAGEAIVQQLVLDLDPYPRKPGVEFEDVKEKPEKTSPFSVLSGLKDEGEPSSS